MKGEEFEGKIYTIFMEFSFPQIGQKSGKWRWRHNMPTRRHCRIFVDVVVFLWLLLDSGPSFVSISLLDLKYDNFYL